MNRIIFLVIFLVIFSAGIRGQEVQPTPEPKTVLVTQVFVDDATKAFDEVVALRSTVKLKNEAIVGLVELITEYAQADTAKKKKSIWKKIGTKAVKLIDAATDPETIRTVATLVILAKAAER